MLKKIQTLSALLVAVALASCNGSEHRESTKILKGDAVWYYPASQSILIHLTEPKDEYLLVHDISEFSYAKELRGRLLKHKIDSVTVDIGAYDQKYTKSPEHDGRTAWVNIGFTTAELTNRDRPIGVSMGKPLDEVIFGSRAELTARLQTEGAIEMNPIPVSGQYVFNFVRGVEHIAGP
jgi:hypothetical protein